MLAMTKQAHSGTPRALPILSIQRDLSRKFPLESQNTALNKNHRMGTSKDGSMFRALQSLIFKIARPELKMRTPPIREISVNNSAVKNADKDPEKR